MIQRLILPIALIFSIFLWVMVLVSASISPIQNPITKTAISTSTKQTITKNVAGVVATTTKTNITPPPKPAVTAKKIEVPQAVITTPKPATDFEAINQFTRKAVVNILCSSYSMQISSISGTGVMIDPRGIILTNAHIGQYWLLHDFPSKDSVECVIRTGNPAYPQYKAELMFISPTWVENNKDNLKSKDPTGTGEGDFAFLLISERTNNQSAPTSFDYVPINIDENISQNENVVLVSYPAGFLGGMTVLQNLNMTSAITTIQKLYTFKENTIDLISVGGTVVSQKGASGGAVVDDKSFLIGLITTSTDAATTNARELNAITLAYINRALQKETNGGIQNLLAQNPLDVVQTFQNTLSETLSKLLTGVLDL